MQSPAPLLGREGVVSHLAGSQAVAMRSAPVKSPYVAPAPQTKSRRPFASQKGKMEFANLSRRTDNEFLGVVRNTQSHDEDKNGTPGLAGNCRDACSMEGGTRGRSHRRNLCPLAC